jgi:peptidoglycan hydrolase CwlO-like protein
MLRKITILKEGVLAERTRKRHLESELEKARNKIDKFEDENNRKDKKYEELTAEIKKLKDEIIEERNTKHVHSDLFRKYTKRFCKSRGKSS